MSFMLYRFAIQVNVLVDGDGIPYISGLGSAYIPSHSTLWEARDDAQIDQFSSSGLPGSTWQRMSLAAINVAHPTKAGDIYAFGVMVFEVGMYSFPLCSVRSLETGPHGTTRISRGERDHSNALDVHWVQATTTWYQRGLGCCLEHHPVLLGPCGTKAYRN